MNTVSRVSHMYSGLQIYSNPPSALSVGLVLNYPISLF